MGGATIRSSRSTCTLDKAHLPVRLWLTAKAEWLGPGNPQPPCPHCRGRTLLAGSGSEWAIGTGNEGEAQWIASEVTTTWPSNA
jgi:hypothetical protein